MTDKQYKKALKKLKNIDKELDELKKNLEITNKYSGDKSIIYKAKDDSYIKKDLDKIDKIGPIKYCPNCGIKFDEEVKKL